MTILPKKKQQPSGQQQQQDNRHQQHVGGVNVRNIDESGGSGQFLNVSSNVGAIGSSSAQGPNNTGVSSTNAITSYLPISAAGSAVASLPSPHHGGDAGSGASHSCIGTNATPTANAPNQTRRPSIISHFGTNDPIENEGSFGPHRKRAAISGTGGAGVSSPRASQSERSSPYRTTRRSNRGGHGTVSASSSAPPPAVLTAAVLGTYGNVSTGPISSNASAVGPHNARNTMPSSESREDEAGYNSEDEYERNEENAAAAAEETEWKFEEKLLAAKSLKIKKMKEDGACLFRAVADQVYGDEEMHGVVRKLCMDYIAKNSDYFNHFVTEDFASYVERKRQETTHGNHVEMQAMAELFNRPIQVYQYSCEPINTFHSPHETDNPAIRVSYHRNIHYNSVVDPNAATIGVGLGLPQYYPGLADKNLMQDAVHASEQHEIEEAMLEDKLRATDWEATDEQLQEQVAKESYLQWLRDQEKQMKENAATRDGVSTTTTNPIASGPSLLDSGKPSCSKAPNVQNDRCVASSSSAGGSSAFYGNTWEEDDELLKEVMALSQQEYFDSLKSHRQEDADGQKGGSSRNQS